MRVGAVQIHSQPGGAEANLEQHLMWARRAQFASADVLLFPELSLTGYQPERACALSMPLDALVFDRLQTMADASGMTVGVGAPIRTVDEKPLIAMVVLKPSCPRSILAKRYLHSDEEPFFSPGQGSIGMIEGDRRLALAICYEMSVPAHAEEARHAGAEVYFVSAAKTVRQVAAADQRLLEVVDQHNMTVVFCNGVGAIGGETFAGRSSVWNSRGDRLGKLTSTDEGLLIFDTDTQALEIVHADGNGDSKE